MTRVVLTIAGHDPSGGAGISADLRAVEVLGCTGISAITALTVQNTHGVESYQPTDPAVLRNQIRSLLSDIKPHSVKIGMLAGAAQVRVVADAIREFDLPNVVLDTVFASSGGVSLLDACGIDTMIAELFPICAVITPNIDEAERLTGLEVRCERQMAAAARQLLEMGAKRVLVKGGHLAGAPVDVLVASDCDSPVIMPEDRIETGHTHGTGCLLSSLMAARLALGDDLVRAILESKRVLAEGLANPVVIGHGRGYPNPWVLREQQPYVAVPETGPASQLRMPAPRRKHDELIALLRGVYVISDRAMRPDRTPAEILRAALHGGAACIQLRSKGATDSELLSAVRSLDAERRAHNAILIVNDNVGVALAGAADGVHLGPDDLPPEDARRLLGPDRLVGVSVNNLDEAEAAAPFASYFGVGPVFGTTSKNDAGAAIGTARLREIKTAFPDIPIVAVGGINGSNIAQVRDAAVEAAAVISAVVCAQNMEAATRELVEIWRAG